jgi:hypothetical protein
MALEKGCSRPPFYFSFSVPKRDTENIRCTCSQRALISGLRVFFATLMYLVVMECSAVGRVVLAVAVLSILTECCYVTIRCQRSGEAWHPCRAVARVRQRSESTSLRRRIRACGWNRDGAPRVACRKTLAGGAHEPKAGCFPGALFSTSSSAMPRLAGVGSGEATYVS